MTALFFCILQLYVGRPGPVSQILSTLAGCVAIFLCTCWQVSPAFIAGCN